jgi:parallel beta-helix repeat protein
VCEVKTIRKSIAATIAIACTLLSLVCNTSDVISQSMMTVGPGMRFSSIRSAIDAAGPDAVIMVYSGTYRENVVVDRPLTLIGVDDGGGKPVIDGMSNGKNAISVRANGVTIDGFTIKNGYSGIDITGAGSTTIRNCDVTGNTNHGIHLENSDDNVIEANDVSGNAQSSVEGDTKNAITLYRSHGNRIHGNTINNNGGTIARDNGAHVYHLGDGVSLLWSNNNVITNNVMTDDHYAVWIYHSSNATVTGNKATGMYYDITIEYGTDSLVADNTLRNAGRNLKVCSYSSGNTIRGNIMSGGIYGITLDDSWYNTLEGNKVSGSKYDDLVLINASHNTIR